MNEPLLITRRGHTALVTLNRPDTRNALSGEDMFAAFEALVDKLNADLSVRAAVLTGAGSAFCSGGNVAEMRDRTGMFAGSPEEITERYRQGIQRIPRALARLQVPLIAAVNGPAIGAGLDLACMCDVRIAGQSARFAESFVKLGLVSGDGGAWLLPRIVGISKASQLSLTGEMIDAAEALRIGLVSDVVPDEDLMATARRQADAIAANPPHATRMTKRLLRAAQTAELSHILEMAGAMQALAHATADHDEAIDAFFDRRPPTFKGD